MTVLPIVLTSLISIAFAFQLTVGLAFIFSFIPIAVPAYVHELFARHQPLVLPEREMLFYRFFILSALVSQVLFIWKMRSQAWVNAVVQLLLPRMMIEGGWALLMGFAGFKVLMNPQVFYFKVFFACVMLSNVLRLIFAQEIGQGLRRLETAWGRVPGQARIIDALAVLFIINAVAVKDIHLSLGQMFMVDHWHHLDTMITSPAWAFLKGGVLNVDQFSHYAIGLPVVLGFLTTLTGSFSYPHLLGVMIALTIAYYVVFYALVNKWLGSRAVALAAVVLLIKWQMYHPGVVPFVFNYPSATPLRFGLDLLVLGFLLMHLRSMRRVWLWAAAASVGFNLFYMIDTGLYLMVAFISYLGCYYVRQLQDKQLAWQRAALLFLGLIGFAVLVCAASLYGVQGKALLSIEFWQNMAERTQIFLSGHGNLPVYKSLMEGRPVEFLGGLLIPLMYTLALIVIGSMFFLRRIAMTHALSVAVIVYGLCLYHYYILRSADTSYDVVIMPLVILLAITIQAACGRWPGYALRIKRGAVVIAFFALLTNHYYLNYPHWLNFNKDAYTRPWVPMTMNDGSSFLNHHHHAWNPGMKLDFNSLGETDEGLKTEKDFASDAAFAQFVLPEMDFAKDAQLISRKTAPTAKVALISSFETKILMQADRAPFFYYFPLVDSRPMRMRMWDMTALWTKARLERTLKQLQEEKPDFIFMEKVFLAAQVPQAYQFLCPDLLVLVEYIRRYYQPQEEGRYLVAMQRKQ